MADGSPLEALEQSRRKAVRRIVTGLAALLGVLAFGTAGYVVLGWTVSDALYMVVITVSGVGFNEVHEINTAWLRAHTIMVITFGLVATGYTVAGILGFVTEEEIGRLLGHQ